MPASKDENASPLPRTPEKTASLSKQALEDISNMLKDIPVEFSTYMPYYDSPPAFDAAAFEPEPDSDEPAELSTDDTTRTEEELIALIRPWILLPLLKPSAESAGDAAPSCVAPDQLWLVRPNAVQGLATEAVTGKRKRELEDEGIQSDASREPSVDNDIDDSEDYLSDDDYPSTSTAHLASTSTLPFVCTWKDCSKRFNREADRNRHLKVHAPKAAANLLQCQVCGKNIQSGREDSLRRHQQQAKACIEMQKKYTNAELREMNCVKAVKRTAATSKAKRKSQRA